MLGLPRPLSLLLFVGPSPVRLFFFLVIVYDYIVMSMNTTQAGFIITRSSSLCSVFPLTFKEIQTFLSALNNIMCPEQRCVEPWAPQLRAEQRAECQG